MTGETGDAAPHEHAGGGLIRCGNCDRLFNCLVNAARCPACGHDDRSELPPGWTYRGP